MEYEYRFRILDDPQRVFDGMGASIIAIDLAAIGRRVAERGKKAIKSGEFSAQTAVRQVRGLTGIGANDS